MTKRTPTAAEAQTARQARAGKRSNREHLKAPFLVAMERLRTGNIYDAAAEVGVDPHTVTAWKKDDPVFLEAFTRIEIDCKTRDNERTRSTALKLANEGAPKFLIKNGQMVPQLDPKTGEQMIDSTGQPVWVTVERRYDGGLIEFLLERRMPEEFSHRVETRVSDGVVARISSLFMAVIRKLVPEFCPHCKSHLGLHAEIVKELETQSAKMTPS